LLPVRTKVSRFRGERVGRRTVTLRLSPTWLLRCLLRKQICGLHDYGVLRSDSLRAPTGRVVSHGAQRRRRPTRTAEGSSITETLVGTDAASIEEDYSEVCWFYDLDATPSMPEGPIAVNVFARLYDADTFFAVCRSMRLEGAKRLEIARA
jgi:hypothetical protein